MHKGLQHYFKTQAEAVATNVVLARESYTVEAIHDLRVGIKRIRALFRLLEYLNPKDFKTKKHIRPFRYLFKSAALLRDVQVQLGLLETYEELSQQSYPAFRAYFTQLEKEGKRKLGLAITAFPITQLQQKEEKISIVLAHIDEATLQQRTYKRFQKRLKKVRKLSLNSSNPLIMHQIRIKLKEAVYLLDLIRQYGNDTETLKAMFKHLKYTEQAIGAWNDRSLLRERLIHCVKELKLSPMSQDKKMYQKLALTLQQEIAEQQEQIQSALGEGPLAQTEP